MSSTIIHTCTHPSTFALPTIPNSDFRLLLSTFSDLFSCSHFTLTHCSHHRAGIILRISPSFPVFDPFFSFSYSAAPRTLFLPSFHSQLSLPHTFCFFSLIVVLDVALHVTALSVRDSLRVPSIGKPLPLVLSAAHHLFRCLCLFLPTTNASDLCARTRAIFSSRRLPALTLGTGRPCISPPQHLTVGLFFLPRAPLTPCRGPPVPFGTGRLWPHEKGRGQDGFKKALLLFFSNQGSGKPRVSGRATGIPLFSPGHQPEHAESVFSSINQRLFANNSCSLYRNVQVYD
ncbi:hypothetical protein B0H15DRAFT_343808 [Mycena belliarum]|uniref:Uncharacterized protein n=1 Tax=Mycena belliarum TaxID=1033014 RepID=A0AAD6U1Z0_9AGAR|nr:hypothetical protein B0H15DRAFT_343808 [Mycena belliae]